MKFFAVALMFIGLTACSGSSSFSPEKCQQLEEKIKANEELTESDYNEMIDQMGAAIEVLAEKDDQWKDDEQKQKEFIKSEEGKQVVGAIIGFGLYLDSHSKDLTPAHAKKLQALEKRFKELDK